MYAACGLVASTCFFALLIQSGWPICDAVEKHGPAHMVGLARIRRHAPAVYYGNTAGDVDFCMSAFH